MASLSDDNLIRARLAADDPAALELMWGCYSGCLLGYLISILCSRQDAEDALQMVFIKAAKYRQSLAQAQSLKSYLFRMGKNEALGLIRQRQGRELVDPGGNWLETAAETGQVEELPRLQEWLAALPEEQRTVLMLNIYQELTFREIAELLEISENTATSRYRYAIDKLRRQMRRETP